MMLALSLFLLGAMNTYAQAEAAFTVVPTEDGSGVVITGYNGRTGRTARVIIPSTIQGMPVREIGNWRLPEGTNYEPFAGNRGITSVVIPNGVTLIGAGAFSSCQSLSQVTIPESVTRIGSNAFFGCSSLRSITLPDSITEMGEDGYGYVFSHSGLASITLPGNLREIRPGTFQNCRNLTSVIISEGVEIIDQGAFEGCTALASVTLPSTIRLIRDRAFYGCTALTTITIPNSAESIVFESDSFGNCPGLTSETQAALRRVGY